MVKQDELYDLTKHHCHSQPFYPIKKSNEYFLGNRLTQLKKLHRGQERRVGASRYQESVIEDQTTWNRKE